MKKWKSRILDFEVLKPENFNTKEEWLTHISLTVLPGIKTRMDEPNVNFTNDTKIDYWFYILTDELDRNWISCED